MSTFKNKKSAGNDEIFRSIKEKLTNKALTIPIYLMKQSSHSGIFPNEFKTSIIIPLQEVGNYHPIPLICTTYDHLKTCEAIRIIHFLAKQKNYH